MKPITAEINTDENGVLRLLQITDTHLFSNKEGTLLGMKTQEGFDDVVQHAKQFPKKFNAILTTGDISQDHSYQSYLHFAEQIKTFNVPCYWLPGNHDEQPVMNPCLIEQGLPLVKMINSKHWQIILLDSQVKDVPHGFLSQEELDFLTQALESNPDKFSLVCLHHHVIPVGSNWLDQHILKNADQLLEIINKNKNAIAVLSGHVHQTQEIISSGAKFITTPSTCVQFQPDSEFFSIDVQPPGYRFLSLNSDGTIETSVKRLDDWVFSVDLCEQGY